MIFHRDSDRLEESCDDDIQAGDTASEFKALVYAWTESLTSDLWKYFGCLNARDVTEREVHKLFASWSSILERKAGTQKFRMVVGIERRQSREFYYHIFIGGVVPRADFEKAWSAQWLQLGGSSAWLHKFNGSFAGTYLNYFSPKARFKCTVRLPAKVEHRVNK